MLDQDQESYQIRRPLPPLINQALTKREIKDEQVLIATDTDLDISGEYSESWVVITKDLVLVYMIDEEEDQALLLKELPIKNVQTARTDTRVGSGFLEAKTNGVFEELVRFSNRHADKFAKIAAKIKSLAEGKQVQVEPEEEVVRGRCQKCGVRMPDPRMTVCPKCLKRGLIFMRFLGRTKEYWGYTVLAMTLVIVTILLSLVPQQFVRVLIDNVFNKETILPIWFAVLTDAFGFTTPMQWLTMLIILLAVTTLLVSGVACVRELLATRIANRLAFDLRRDVFRKLEDMAIKYHDMHPVGQLMTRCSQDVEALQGFINQLTSGFGYQIILVFSVAVVMFTMDLKLAFWACIPAPIVMVCTVIFYKHIVPRWNKYWTTRSDLSNALHASLSGIRVVKAFAQEAREGERFDQYSGRFRDAGFDVGYSQALFYPFMGFVFQLGSFVIWWIGGRLILEGMAPEAAAGAVSKLSIGELMAFLGYLGMFYGPLNSLTQMSAWFTSFTTQAHRVFEILDEPSEIHDDTDSVDLEIQGAIAFKNVAFGYDPHIPVLHDVSFQVHPGEMIGIVGHSGSGKSTTVNLIMRFYEPTDGVVTIDNIDTKKIRKTCLRRQIGMVPQDPFLFRGTITQNICYGNPSVAPELVLNAALAANAHMFITRIHDGYDTRLGEHGSGLSGGERQRVAIARALLHNPRVLILDEATSSVDTIAEREIQKSMEALSLGRTVITIAHRLSTLRNCDRILVFEEGRIREQGTHAELMALNGIYKKLVEIQTQLTSERETTVDSLKAVEDLAKAEAATAAVKEKARDKTRGPVPRIRYLDPKQVHIYAKDEGDMRVVYKDEEYDHVRAYRCFPVSRPSEFIALWTGDSALEHHEIGMIRRLKELAPSSRLAVEHELAKRYFIHYVQKIASIKEDIGFLTWQVETDKGPIEFMSKRWDRNTVVEGGENGRIIFDVDKNRYEIEDLDELDPSSKAIFLKHIYW